MEMFLISGIAQRQRLFPIAKAYYSDNRMKSKMFGGDFDNERQFWRR